MSELRSPWSGRMATLSQLPWTERWTLVQATVILTVVQLSLRAFGFRRVHAMASRAAPRSARISDAAAARVQTIARVVDIASRHTLVATTCLHRALTLWWMLRRGGLDASLHLGTRKVGEAFEAHAWVEHGGLVVNDRDVVRNGYVPLAWRP